MFMTGFGARDLHAPDLLPADLVDAASGVVVSRYADRGLIYSDNSFYRAGLLGDVVISQSAIDAIGMGGRIGLTASQIELWNGDNALDDVAAECRTAGRAIRVRTVPAPSPWRSDAGGSLSQAQTAFAGVLSGMSPEGQRMRLTLDDLGWRLSKPLQANLYDGTGGLGGTAELAGQPKPISFGWRYQVTPVYIGQVDLGDGAKHTYQTHWRRIAGHDAVRERGIAMDKTESSPGVGEWKDWPAVGCFQTGFSPNGIVTCDVRGDAVPYYAATTVQIIQRLLSTLGPRFGTEDFDTASLALVATQVLGEIGWGCGTEVLTAGDAVAGIAQQSGIWVIGNRLGQLRLALAQFYPGVENMTLGVGDIISCRPIALPASLTPTPQTVEVMAGKNWTPLTDISSGVSASDRLSLSGQGRIVRKTSPLISSRQFQSRTMNMGGLFRYDTDANRRVLAMIAWLESGLRGFEITTDRYLGQVEIGHVLHFTYPLFGLSGGFTGVVAGWSEQIGRRRVTMTVVG